MSHEDVIGKRFHSLVVTGITRGKIRPSERYEGELLICRCDCGNEKLSEYSRLRSGRLKSCGCLKSDFDPSTIIGKRFHSLVVTGITRGRLYPNSKRKHLNTLMVCRCDCGKEKLASYINLKRRLKSCGCLQYRSGFDPSTIIGKTFGKITVLETVKMGKRYVLRGRCECGTVKTYQYSSLRRLKSCGCVSKEIKRNLIGKRFGHLVVVRLHGRRDGKRRTIKWVAKCDCGKTSIVSSSNLLCGRTNSCGCLRGTGRYVDDHGYVVCRAPPGHPRKKSNGGIAEHLLVMERIIGRPVRRDETVHHKNTIRHDNRPENLELWASSQPSGGRVTDMVKWAKEILTRYPDELLINLDNAGSENRDIQPMRSDD